MMELTLYQGATQGASAAALARLARGGTGDGPAGRARGANRLPDAGLPAAQPDRADLLLLRDGRVRWRRSPAAPASTNWEAFQLPMAIMFAAQGGSAGLNMVADIESGYFDKLLVTPANRFSILIGAMSADFLRVMVQAALVLLVAVAVGLDFATGVPGAVALDPAQQRLGPGLLGHRLRGRAQDRQRPGDAEHVGPLHAPDVPDDRCSRPRKRFPAGWTSPRPSTR